MVDVTILLYLPINTSLDDLAFVADWGQKIVGLAEEKAIINGKNTRYMRQRVMPMMYNPNNDIRPVDSKVKTRENTESWLKRLRKRDKEALPSWVKSHNLYDSEDESSNKSEYEHSSADSAGCSQGSGASSGHGSNNGSCGAGHDGDELCDCKVNRKNYLDVIREAVHFTYPTPTCSEASGSIKMDESDNDSVFSDEQSSDEDEHDCRPRHHQRLSKSASNSRRNSQQNSPRGSQNNIHKINSIADRNGPLMGSNTSIEGLSEFSIGNESHNSSGKFSNRSEFSNKSKYSSYTGSSNPTNIFSGSSGLERDIKNMNLKTSSRDGSTCAMSIDGRSDISRPSSFGSSRSSTHTVSNNKHVILSVAMGYDRDSMKEVRKVINETGVALLSVGIGDRGMIGLGGYFCRKMQEITRLQETLVNRLANLV